MKAQIERMCRAMSWANQEVLGSLHAFPAAQESSLPLMAHIVVVEQVWMSRLRENAVSRPLWPQFTMTECASLAAENAADYAGYLQGLSESDLMTNVRFRNSRGLEFTSSRVDILIHVVTHGAYHRGQIAKAVAKSGGQSAVTDYIQFVRAVEPVDASEHSIPG